MNLVIVGTQFAFSCVSSVSLYARRCSVGIPMIEAHVVLSCGPVPTSSRSETSFHRGRSTYII